MSALAGASPVIPQRWERPFSFGPGSLKRLLATKYLARAGRGDLAGVRALLAEHPEFLNRRGSHNRTLLWEAARQGRLEMVQWLVEQGAEVDATGAYSSESQVQLTPYCAAIYYRRPAVAQYLSPQNPQLDVFRAAFLGDQERVAQALAADPSLLWAEDPADPIYFMPLLVFPVAGGQAAMLAWLLQQGAPVAPYSAGLLCRAAAASRMDLLELLIAYGADVRAVEGGVFAVTSDLDILTFLLDRGTSATRTGKNGFPPLVYVARGDKGGHADKVELLLKYGAEVNARGPGGRTALHYAAAGGYTAVIQVLLAHGADPDLRDAQGQTALDQARAIYKTAAAQLLSLVTR
jgi:ankyrin repeat protein